MAATPHDLQPSHLRYLLALVRRLEAHGVDATVRASVDVLTSDAVPDRAAGLAVRPAEPAVLVERLAVWAMHRASESALAEAREVLERGATSSPNRFRVLVT